MHRKTWWFGNKDWTLLDTIREDIKYFHDRVNKDRMFPITMQLTGGENGLYSLNMNGNELAFGTPNEINAALKAVVKLMTQQENII